MCVYTLPEFKHSPDNKCREVLESEGKVTIALARGQVNSSCSY